MTKKRKSKTGKMKAYENFDTQAEDQIADQQEPIKIIKTDFNMLTEFVKWGNGCWVYDDISVCYMMYGGYKDHVQFGFFCGLSLKDPKKMLQGESKFIRQAVKNVKSLKD